MTDDDKGLVAAGASRVWRRQRVLWWVYAVNLVLGLLGAAGAHSQLGKLLKFSLAGDGLTKGFDFGMFLELLSRPEANLMRSAGSSFLFACLFPLFMIFVSGGIIAVYREDRKFTAGDFFAASGAFFWRFVRLALFSLVPFGILFGALQGIDKLSDYLGDRVVSAKVGFHILLVGMIVITLLVLFVRLWFDIAQVRAVVQDERKMWPSLWKALGITWRNRLTLFRVYLCISGVAWVTLAAGLWIWAKLPPTWTPVTFLLLQFIILMQLLARLWQRASSVTWYMRHAAAVSADAVDFTTAAPAEIVEPMQPVTDSLDPSTPPNLEIPGPTEPAQ
ncbi:MAG TPA: hypothetical protein VE779_00015 [Candidatus Angelobacter sp.]|nr:hypothetical protein [Candidatus Angelobacter sp.]